MELLERNNLSLHREYTDQAYDHPEYDTARPGFKQMVAAHLRGEFSHIIAFDLSYLTSEPIQACVLYEQAEEHHPLTIITTNGDIDITNGGKTPFSIQIAMVHYNLSIAHKTVGNNPDFSLPHRLDITPDEFSPEYDHIGSCMYRCALCATTFRTNDVYYKCPHCEFQFNQNLVDHTVASMIADVCDRKFIFDGVQYAPDNTYMRR